MSFIELPDFSLLNLDHVHRFHLHESQLKPEEYCIFAQVFPPSGDVLNYRFSSYFHTKNDALEWLDENFKDG